MHWVYSDDAEALISKIQTALASKRVNLLDQNSGFYRTCIEEIESILHQYDEELEIKHVAEAIDYRKTLTLQKSEFTPDRAPKAKLVESPDILMALAQN